MNRSGHTFGVVGFLVLAYFAANGQQNTAVGSRPGSAIKAVKPAVVTKEAEHASMTISCQPGVELMITDSRGRRLGDDPVGHASYDEIPSAYYEAGGIDDDETGEPEEDPAKLLYVQDPAGSYKLSIIGEKTGRYSCEFGGMDTAGKASQRELKDVGIERDQVQVFTVRFAGTAGSKIEVERK